MHLEALASKVTIRMEGVFDADAAIELRKTLDALALERATLDFSRVHTFVDLAVGVLARELGGRPVVLTLEGLPEHHERLFQYLGFGVGRARSRRTAYQPEELQVG
jgi:hypothetical protein